MRFIALIALAFVVIAFFAQSAATLPESSASSLRIIALPTIPRWPATKILSDFFNCTVVSSQKSPGGQDAYQVFGLAENNASILNSEE